MYLMFLWMRIRSEKCRMIFEIQGLTYKDLRSNIIVTKEVMIQDSTMKPHGGPVHGVSFRLAVFTIPI